MEEVDPTRALLLRHITHVDDDYWTGQDHPLGLGGVARYRAVVTSTIELAQAVRAACEAELPYRVLGLGERTLIVDEGFEGLLIENRSQSYALSQDQSQVVVDGGMALRRLITIAANVQLGGLVHLYPESGTVGGALFYNTATQGQPISASLRSLTILQPPTKIRPDPSIVRYQGSWLTARVTKEGSTRLRQIAERDPYRLPVVLTAQLQLTSLRSDELQRRLQAAVQRAELEEPQGKAAQTHFGPILCTEAGVNLEELFQLSGAYKLRVEGLRLSPHFPNYVTRATSLFASRKPEPVRVEALVAFTTALQELLEHHATRTFVPAYSVLK